MVQNTNHLLEHLRAVANFGFLILDRLKVETGLEQSAEKKKVVQC
jgi:hypothetical protein